MTTDIPWQPGCFLKMLRVRAAMLTAIRRHFDQHSYLEVETPLLSRDIVVDAHLHPYSVLIDEEPFFLQTSPEACMKRLLAAGSGSIYQITKSFRKSEFGQKHNPEFTMVEWYGKGTSESDQIMRTQELITAVVRAAADEAESLVPDTDYWNSPYAVSTYEDVFDRVLNVDVFSLSDADLRRLMEDLQMHVPDETADRNDLLNQILAERIEPELGRDRPEFLRCYPLTQAALAEQNPDDPRTALRFELYARGLELCNGYQELTDADELERRDEQQNTSRESHGTEQLPGAPRLVAAMMHGLPACSGVALGFDRLVMAIMKTPAIADVIPFPINRA